MCPAILAGTRMVLQRRSAEGVHPALGLRADLVTICRAFHWLDQPAVHAWLDGQVAPGRRRWRSSATTVSGLRVARRRLPCAVSQDNDTFDEDNELLIRIGHRSQP